tara:strand:- start:615 stop:1160 length:546 start_codon:yes stop_codon:yes gene_type:complete
MFQYRKLRFIFVIVWSAFLASCEDNKNKEIILYKGPVQEVNNVEVLYSEQGALKVQMKTPLQLTYRNENKVFPDTVNINFYNPEGSLITKLRADSGHYDKIQDVFVVLGNVRVVMSEENQILKTTELSWSPRTRKIFTDKPLTLRNNAKGEITKGVGMDADQDFSHIKFRKGTGIYPIDNL